MHRSSAFPPTHPYPTLPTGDALVQQQRRRPPLRRLRPGRFLHVRHQVRSFVRYPNFQQLTQRWLSLVRYPHPYPHPRSRGQGDVWLAELLPVARAPSRTKPARHLHIRTRTYRTPMMDILFDSQAVLGVAGGLLGSAFTAGSELLVAWRRDFIAPQARATPRHAGDTLCGIACAMHRSRARVSPGFSLCAALPTPALPTPNIQQTAQKTPRRPRPPHDRLNHNLIIPKSSLNHLPIRRAPPSASRRLRSSRSSRRWSASARRWRSGARRARSI